MILFCIIYIFINNAGLIKLKTEIQRKSIDLEMYSAQQQHATGHFTVGN